MSSPPQTPPMTSVPQTPPSSASVPRTSSVPSVLQTAPSVESVPIPPPKSKFRRFWKWEPTEKTKKRPCWVCLKKSKVPGLKEAVAEDTHVSIRIFWITAFFICLFGGIYWMFLASKIEPTVRTMKTERYLPNQLPYAVTIEKLNSVTNRGITELDAMENKFVASSDSNITHDGSSWTKEEFKILKYFLNLICMPTNKLAGWSQNHNFVIPSDNPFADSITNDLSFYDDSQELDFSRKASNSIKKVTAPCSEMFGACTWNYEGVDCGTLFHDVYSESGAVCSFNAMPIHLTQKNESIVTILNERKLANEEQIAWKNLTEEEKFLLPVNISINETGRQIYTIPEAQYKAGQEWGLRSVLLFNEEEIFCRQPSVFAYRAAVHLPTRRGNPRSRGFTIPPNHEVTVRIIPVFYSASEATRKGANSTDRNCYFKNEVVALERHTIYTLENCEDECLALRIEAECNCTHIYTSRSPTNRTRICVTRDDMKCVHSAEVSVFGVNSKGSCPDCLPNCNTGAFQTQISSIPYPQDNPPDYVKLLDLDPKTPTAVLIASIEESRIQGFEDQMRRDTQEHVATLSGILGTTNNLTLLDLVKILFAAVGLLVPIKGVLDFIVFYAQRKLKPRVARKVDASVFEDIRRLNLGLIQIGATMTRPTAENPEGATMQEIGVDLEKVESMEEVDTVLKKFMRQHCSEYGRHWTDWASEGRPRVLVTTSLDGCGPNRASPRQPPPIRPHPKCPNFRRGSAPAGMSQISEDEVAETEEAPPFRFPPMPGMEDVFLWYVSKGYIVNPPPRPVATAREGQQPGNNSDGNAKSGNCLTSFFCCCTEPQNDEEAAIPLAPSPPSPPQQGPSTPPTASSSPPRASSSLSTTSSSSSNQTPVSTIVELFDGNEQEASVFTPEPLFRRRKNFKEMAKTVTRVRSLYSGPNIYENPAFEPDDNSTLDDEHGVENSNLEEPLELKSITPSSFI